MKISGIQSKIIFCVGSDGAYDKALGLNRFQLLIDWAGSISSPSRMAIIATIMDPVPLA